MSELKDVKCEKCGRAIGQREGAIFYQFGMKTKFNKSARIFCPFLGCGFEQDFKINREMPHKAEVISLTKIFT